MDSLTCMTYLYAYLPELFIIKLGNVNYLYELDISDVINTDYVTES
jgi:hypothetical protein